MFGNLSFSDHFLKSNICWPQQPPRERCQMSVKNWNFHDPFHKKVLLLVIWVPGMIQPRISKYFDELRLSRSLRPLRSLRLLRSLSLKRF